jgi:energy-coupling factor transporter ATP-binding protein EcfA2
MRLLNLKVRNFRGFGNEPAFIDFDAELILFFGPNGFGKTSLSEAIEWLFYGTTKRRQRGDALNRTEYQGSFCNAHGGLPVEVTARVLLPGLGEHTLSRRIDAVPGEQSRTFVDDAPAGFEALGLRPIEAVYPIVAQHGLQTFVHTKPRERRDAISAAFGLDELADLKVALDGARRSFGSNPPAAIVQARTKMRALGVALARLAETAGLAQRWQRTPHPQVRAGEDLAALKTAARRMTGEDTEDVERLLEALRALRSEAVRQAFDVRTLAPATDSDARWERTAAMAGELASKTAELAQAVATVVANSAAYAVERLVLWEKGLIVAPTGDQCPMCEADTLTAEKRAELRGRLDASRTSVAADRKIGQLSAQAASLIGQMKDAISHALRPGVSAADAALLDRLFADEPARLAAFVAINEALSARTASMTAAATALTGYLESIAGRLGDLANAPAIVAEGEALPCALAAAVSDLQEAARRYQAAWGEFEPLLSSRIASSENVAAIDAINEALLATPQMSHIAAYDILLERSLALMQAAETALKTHQATLLTTRGAEMSTLYDLMNPGSDVRFARMVPATDSLRLEATSFGVAMSAAANLSECQLNCLGLAVALMQATTPGSPFGFVLLDDPVQSMDDEHCEAFLASVLPQLIGDHGKQVIVLSHLTPIVDRARALNIDRRVRVYNFENYLLTGPVIVEQVKLKKQIAEIKGLMAGNEANRELAVDRLRVLVEATVRELHISRVGPVPPEHDTAMPAQLLALFQSIPGTSPAEHQGLRDTVGFCDPAHHTDATYTVPTRGNIQPHLDRVTGLIARYKLAN